MFNRILGSQTTARASKMEELNTKPIVWMDLEMTGLDPKTNRIIEIACLVTDSQLNVISSEPLQIVIRQPDALLDAMDEWCTRTHTATGLLKQCKESRVTEQEAETEVVNFLKKYVKPNESPLGGNTIYMDRIFLREQMPQINKYLHYRVVDVSSIRELCHRWNLETFRNRPQKKLVHRGVDDILETIEELKYYRQFMFNNWDFMS